MSTTQETLFYCTNDQEPEHICFLKFLCAASIFLHIHSKRKHTSKIKIVTYCNVTKWKISMKFSWFVAIIDNVQYFNKNNKCTHDPIIDDEFFSWSIIASAATDWWSARADHRLTSKQYWHQLINGIFCQLVMSTG